MINSARVPEDHRYVWVTGRRYGSEEPECGIGWYDGSNWVTQSGSIIFDVTYWEELSESLETAIKAMDIINCAETGAVAEAWAVIKTALKYKYCPECGAKLRAGA